MSNSTYGNTPLVPLINSRPAVRASRPDRRVPQALNVAKYWAGRGREMFDVIVDLPKCFRCASPRTEWRELERAHLIDRSAYGLDHAGNLVMLCEQCHFDMPSFETGEGAFALAWAARTTTARALEFLALFGQPRSGED